MAKQRQTVIALGAGAILVVAIGVLWAVSNVGRKPEEIRAELETRIAELNAIPDTDPIRKAAFAQELVDNESYRKYALSLLVKVERVLPKLKDAARLERAALKDVPPFLTRSRDVSRLSTADLQRMADEGRALLADYGATRHGDSLRAVQKWIHEQLAADPPCTSTDVVHLGHAVQKQIDQKQFAKAEELIAEFLKKRRGADQFKSQIDQIREKAHRERTRDQLKRR